MQQRKLASFIVLLYHILVSFAFGQGDTECPQRCMNGSICKAGNATFANHPNDASGNDLNFLNENEQNYHCACEEGFTGLTCSVMYESCADSSTFHTCYHRGTCLDAGQDDFGNKQYGCDCSSAVEGDKYYTGKYCQDEHMQTCDYNQGIFCTNGGVCKDGPNGDSYCQCEDGFHGDLCEMASGVECGSIMCFNGAPCIKKESNLYCDCGQTNIPGKRFTGESCEEEKNMFCDEPKLHFCLNDGECVDEGNGSYSCNCHNDWTGPSCEFESGTREHVDDNCNLECFNGGKCRSGHADDSAASEDRCVCSDGYTGTKCEYAYEECGNGEHMCLHGSKCVYATGFNPRWTCECEEAYREDQNYQGEVCQHHKMTVCTTRDAAFEVYGGSISSVYCVNDGVCTEIEDNGESRPGCKCHDGYTGAHCELLGSSIHKDDKSHGLHGVSSAATIFGIILLAIAIGMFVGVPVVRRTRARGKAIVMIELSTMSSYRDDPLRAVNADDQSFDSKSLEDVELL